MKARVLAGLAALAGLLWLPWLLPAYRLDFAADTLALGLLAVSVTVLWGRCDLMSFGQSVFFGIGAYCVAVIGTRSGAVGWLPLLLTVIVPAAVAGVIGYFLLYGGVRRALFAIVTLPLTAIAGSVALAWGDLTNGQTGLYLYPPLELGPGLVFDDSVSRYYLTLAVCVAVCTATVLVLRSRHGRALSAIATNEAKAVSLGIPAPLYLTLAFTAAGAVAGIGGGLYALTTQVTSAELVGLLLATEAVAWAAVGGRGNVYRAVAAVLVVRLLQQVVTAVVPQAWPILLGLFFVGVVLLAPRVTEALRQRRAGVAP
ncbi:branched-chain amino acid transport system permease protein [Allocatelliglobosispora scoriae]|uniref:Branched-chain amino acid transport system permease protein n=1 Tax=Allocatelliglobosispora scoriae TaxID=643052 RepID=A0A841C3K5_9ACTN|nr:branched-chain amino acid ABC transporter permease [Allocatelliglobosispora scoriae]MBB5874496.1 branched-chain amino acid transport system permease protein [Allocatelliglobosispora scoriae]